MLKLTAMGVTTSCGALRTFIGFGPLISECPQWVESCLKIASGPNMRKAAVRDCGRTLDHVRSLHVPVVGD